METFEAFVGRHEEWSLRTFGPGRQTQSLTRHIEKEVLEIREKPDDLTEWIDVMMLALDGYLRHGGTVSRLMLDMQAKQVTNFGREWKAPTDEDMPTEHVRTPDEK